MCIIIHNNYHQNLWISRNFTTKNCVGQFYAGERGQQLTLYNYIVLFFSVGNLQVAAYAHLVYSLLFVSKCLQSDNDKESFTVRFNVNF